ncbi:MAG: DUF1207 domain-containing protein [Planctomycetota bacterium]
MPQHRLPHFTSVVGAIALLVASSSCASPTANSTRTWKFAPRDLDYPVYIADPRRSTFGIVSLTTSDSEIEGAGNSRNLVRIGARYGILRWGDPDERKGTVQLDGEVGFLGQFDRDNSTDNIGWDGIYGAFLSWRALEQLAFQIGVKHDSSHVGDEFIESTGRQRINYTREEFVAGISYGFARYWRTYAEYAWAYDIRNEDIMERGRVQGGLEFQSGRVFESSTARLFGALDVSSFEENDWDANVNVQAGFAWPGDGKGSVWRVGVEYYDGRVNMGEFFQEDERYFGFGAWLDL